MKAVEKDLVGRQEAETPEREKYMEEDPRIDGCPDGETTFQ